MNGNVFLGLDLGTSGLRGLLIDGKGATIASTQATYAASHPRPGWSEQDPALWRGALDTVATALRDAAPREWAALAGIGVSGHMHGAVLLDAVGEVIRPCILWNDTRSHAEAAELDARPKVRDLSGNIVFPGFTAPKLAWLARHEPDAFARVDKVLLPAAYLNFLLTGELFTDMSDAAGTAWLDTGQRRWSSHLLVEGGMRADQMPRLIEGTDAGATVRPVLARDWGIPTGCVVAGGAGDNAAAACGAGVFMEGTGFVSLGTSGVVMAARDRYAPQPDSAVHTFCHAIPDTWYQMGVILAATDCLNWLGRVVDRAPQDLTAALGDTVQRPGAVMFLPSLSGDRTPHNDPAIRGSFIGLSVGTGPEDLTRAVLEGVAFALRDAKEALVAAGVRFDRTLALGGGMRSAYWRSVVANALHLPLSVPQEGDFGAALGAARLAICAATGARARDVMVPPPLKEIVEPDPDLQADFETAYRSYRRIYPALRDLPGNVSN